VEDTTYSVEVRFDDLMPEEWRERMRKNARREAAVKLMDVLCHNNRSYFTVRVLDEEKNTLGDGPFPGIQYRVWFELAPDEQRKVVMYEPPDYSVMPLRQLSASAVDEIKARVSRQFKRWFGVTD
jgi:hypothetical protein